MKRKMFVICSAAVVFALLLSTGNGFAADASGDTDETTPTQGTSGYQNPAQAMHASNLAAAVASQANPEVAAASQAVHDAETALEEAQASGDQAQIAEAEAALQGAESALADTVAEVTGVAKQQISSMRQSGMGWGQIAHELGVHPGTLGLGHAGKKGTTVDTEIPDGQVEAGTEVQEATAVDLNTGQSKEHGVSNGRSDAASQGLGLGHGASVGGAANQGGGHGGSGGGASHGVGNSSSPSSGHGNSGHGNSGHGGGHGNGNSGGNGNGNGGGRK